MSNLIFWKKLLDSFDDFDEQNNTLLIIVIQIIIKKNSKSGNILHCLSNNRMYTLSYIRLIISLKNSLG